MYQIICDYTKKPIHRAVRGQNYQTVLDKTLSSAGLDALEKKVREKMARQKTYNYGDYRKMYVQSLYEICK